MILHLRSKFTAFSLKFPVWVCFIASFVLLASAFLSNSSTSVSAQAESTIAYQGKIVIKSSGLSFGNGNPSCVNAGADTCDFRMRMYTADSGGTLLWEEVHSDIELGDTSGVFSLRLNSVCQDWAGGCAGSGIDWSNGAIVPRLQVEFDPDGDGDFAEGEIFDRKYLSSTPFSYYSDNTLSVDGFGSEDFLWFAQTSAQSTGNTSNALIHINEDGTSTPNLMEFEAGGIDKFVVTNDGYLSVGGSGSQDGFIDIAASTAAKAQIRLRGGDDVSAPVAVDLWFDTNLVGDGMQLNFYNGSSTKDLLEAASDAMWTESGGLLYLTSVTNDLVIGGTSLTNSIFGIDESAGNFYFGYDNSANPIIDIFGTDGDEGVLGFNTNDTIYFSSANVGIGEVVAEQALDVNGNIQLTGNLLPASAPSYTSHAQTATAIDTSSASVGQYTSTAVGTDGLPVIAYYDVTNTALKVLKCGNAACSSGNTTTTVDNTGTSTGQYTSIAIGTDGFPVVSYYDVTGGDLEFVKCGNAACSSGNTLSTLDSTGNVGQYSSVTIGGKGNPVIAYYDLTNTALKVFECGNNACSSGNTITTVDNTSDVGISSSIKIGSDGLPMISYIDNIIGELELVKCGNASCSTGNTITTLSSAGTVGHYTSLAIGRDGLPVIAYNDTGGTDIEILKCGNSLCSSGNTITTIENTGNLSDPSPVSLTIGADGFPVASYYSFSFGDLKLVKCGNEACSSGNAITTVESTGDMGYYNSIVIGADGLPFIVHHDFTNGDLRASKCANANCASDTLKDNLIAYYKLEESSSTRVDSAGSNDLSPSNPLGSATGKQGNGVDITSGDSLSIADNAAISTGNIDFTVAGWIKFDTIPAASRHFIVAKFTGAGQREYTMEYIEATGRFRFVVFHDGTNFGIVNANNFGTSVGAATSGQWYFVVAWHDSVNNQIGISVNGISDTAAHTTGVFDGTSPFQVGGIDTDATIDEAGFWKKVLTSSERAMLYNQGHGMTCNYDPCSDSFLPNTGYPTGGSDIGSREKYFKDVFAARYYGKSFNINNFDVAEEYEVDDMSIEAGDVVRFKKESSKLVVEKTSNKYEKEVVGVISTEPGLYLKDWENNKVNGRPVALVGRVPVKVSNENGEIRRGDYLTSSSSPGVAMKATEGGYIIGRAMEDFGGAQVDSNLVQEELHTQEIQAEAAIEQMVEEGQVSTVEASEMEEVIEEVTSSTNFGRILMYVDLSYVGEEVYREQEEINQALTVDSFKLTSGENLFKITQDNGSNMVINVDNLIVAGGMDIKGDLKVGGKIVAKEITTDVLEVNGEIAVGYGVNQVAHEGTIAVGQQEVFVENTNIKADSVVYLAVNELVSARVVERLPGKGFKVQVDSMSEDSVEFDYLIL